MVWKITQSRSGRFRGTRPVYNIQMNQYTGLTLDAGPADQEKKIIPIAYPLFNFHTEDIHQAFNYIKELGYQIESDIVEFDDFAYFNISDPDHNIIMICNG